MNNDIFNFVLYLAILLFSVSVHESAHGWMAEKFGDTTARFQGRITLNPVHHIDLVGSIILPLILHFSGAPIFGWAKPVQVNPYNLRNRRKAWVYIAAAGPASNLLIAIISFIVFHIYKAAGYPGPRFIFTFLTSMVLLNVLLAVFNLMPIHPLDGSKILEGTLRGEALRNYEKLAPYGMIIFVVVIFSGVFNAIANPILHFVIGLLRG